MCNVCEYKYGTNQYWQSFFHVVCARFLLGFSPVVFVPTCVKFVFNQLCVLYLCVCYTCMCYTCVCDVLVVEKTEPCQHCQTQRSHA